jgi:hypothetical protein
MIALFQQTERIGSSILGIVIPAVILLMSVIFTWLLYKKFSK